MRLPKRGADPAPRLFFKRLSSVASTTWPEPTHTLAPFFLSPNSGTVFPIVDFTLIFQLARLWHYRGMEVWLPFRL